MVTMMLKVLKVDQGGKQEVNKPRIFIPSQKLVDRGEKKTWYYEEVYFMILLRPRSPLLCRGINIYHPRVYSN